MRRFENATSFWMITVNDDAYPETATLEIRSGALGAAGETTKTPFTGTDWDDGFAKAMVDFDRLIAEKTAEGFVFKGIWEDPDGPDYSGEMDEPDPTDIED